MERVKKLWAEVYLPRGLCQLCASQAPAAALLSPAQAGSPGNIFLNQLFLLPHQQICWWFLLCCRQSCSCCCLSVGWALRLCLGDTLQVEGLGWIRAQPLLLPKAASHHCNKKSLQTSCGGRENEIGWRQEGGLALCQGRWAREFCSEGMGEGWCFCVKCCDCPMINTGKLPQQFEDHILLLKSLELGLWCSQEAAWCLFHGKAHEKGIGVSPNVNQSCISLEGNTHSVGLDCF